MPEYVGNTVTVKGPANILEALVEYTFDFNWIHPVPDDAPSEWVSRHWTTNRNRDPSTFHVEHFSEDKTSLTVWFRTAWSTPFALFAYMTKKRPELEVSVVYSGGNCIDYIGRAVYKNGMVEDVRLYPDTETPKALAGFSKENQWFNYQQWKQMRIDWGLDIFQNVDDVPDTTVLPEHLSVESGSYDTIVCGYDEHRGDWQDKCESCISSNDPANYPEFNQEVAV